MKATAKVIAPQQNALIGDPTDLGGLKLPPAPTFPTPTPPSVVLPPAPGVTK